MTLPAVQHQHDWVEIASVNEGPLFEICTVCGSQRPAQQPQQFGERPAVDTGMLRSSLPLGHIPPREFTIEIAMSPWTVHYYDNLRSVFGKEG